MRLLQIEIINFKAIKYLKLDLENAPIIVLTGENGQGKSSFLEALMYLITDELNDKLVEYINWDEGVEKFNIYGKIEIKDITLEIWIEVSYKGSTKHLVINGEEEYYNSDVTKKLKTIFNPKLLRYSSSSMQHENTAILFERPAERLNKLKSIFGLDLIPETSREINDDINVIKTELAKLQTEKQMLDGKQFDFLQEFDLESADEIEAEFNRLLAEKESYEKDKSVYDAEEVDIREYHNKISKKSVLLNEISVNKKTLSELDIKPVPRFNPTALEKVVDEISALEKDVLNLNSSKDKQTDSNNRLSSLKINKEEALRKASAIVIADELPVDEDGVSKLETEKNELTVKLNELQKSYRLALSGKCPTCNQSYNHSHEEIQNEKSQVEKDLQDKNDQIEKSKAELSKNRLSNTQRSLDINSQNSFLANAELIQKDIDAIKLDDRDYESELLSLNDNLKEKNLIKEEQRKLQTAYNEAVTYNEKNNKEKSNLEAKIELAEKQIQELAELIEPKHTIEKPEWNNSNLYTEAYNKRIVYQTRVAELDRIKKHNENLRKQKEETEIQKAELIKKIDNFHFEIEVMNNVKKILEKDFSSFIIEQGSTDLRNEMNNYFQKTYGKFNVDLKKDNKSVDFFYSPREGVQKPVSMSSGFEKSSLALSFRVALMKFQENCLPMFDEIDSDASDRNSTTMYEHLLSYDGFDQIFCITHKPNTIAFLVNEKNAYLVEF